MALIGNYNQFNKNPGRVMSGLSLSDTRAAWSASGTLRARFYGEASIAAETTKGSTPNGYNPPYSWVLAPKAGGISMPNTNRTSITLTAFPAAGINLTLNTNLSAIMSLVGLLVTSGTMSAAASMAFAANITGKLAASMTGSSSINMTLVHNALAGATLVANATMSMTAGASAIANLTLDLTPFTELSPESLAAAVWNAVGAVYNSSGTMGEKLNNAGAGANPWDETIEGTWTAKELLRIITAVLAGKVSGANTGTETFRDVSDTKDRVITTVDAQGNRTGIVLDET
jgi:hypothetical protein